MSMPWQEWVAAASFLWSVWLLAHNKPLGWWIGLVGTSLYIWIFWVVWLPGEVMIQVYFFLTSLVGIWVWLRGGRKHTEKPVGVASRQMMIGTTVVAVLAWAALFWAFTAVEGRVPFWDSLTTVLSFTAQYYLVMRLVQSWHLWVAVDIIYVPLYASRGLYVTAALYAILLVLAYRGLENFQRQYEATQAQAPPD